MLAGELHQLPQFPLPVRYRAEVLAILLDLGVAPTPRTQPRTVYSHLRALLTFEIRDAKARRRELERFFGPQPLDDYRRQIEALRAKYHLLRRLPAEWVDGPDPG